MSLKSATAIMLMDEAERAANRFSAIHILLTGALACVAPDVAWAYGQPRECFPCRDFVKTLADLGL